MSELKPISECRTVAELLADKSRWTKGRYAADNTDCACRINELTACKWCLDGAMVRIYSKAGNGSYHEAYMRLQNVLLETGPITFNDTHTYEEVYQKVLEAGI